MTHRLPKKSAYSGRLPKGCRHCEKGSKLVLFVTGLCEKKCFYCPLSAEKSGADVVFANEMRVKRTRDIFEEAALIGATGAGITGGDPLVALDRTLNYIRLLKRRFGKGHHIHLYTATTDARAITALAEAGLDELRFHPPPNIWGKMQKSRYAGAIATALETGMDVGVEVPVLPDMRKELLALIKYLDSAGAGFVNLNELEFSETNADALKKCGYRIKNDISSGVAGSEETALWLLENADVDIPLHYCSAAFKDGVQLRKRITRRAHNIARPGDIISPDGLLIKGIIECEHPDKVMKDIIKIYKVKRILVYTNRGKKRVEIAPWVLEKIAPKLGYPSFIIEEYPTADRLEVERTRLG